MPREPTPVPHGDTRISLLEAAVERAEKDIHDAHDRLREYVRDREDFVTRAELVRVTEAIDGKLDRLASRVWWMTGIIAAVAFLAPLVVELFRAGRHP